MQVIPMHVANQLSRATRVLGTRCTALAVAALAAVLLSVPASAVIVEFTADGRAGLGDGGDPNPPLNTMTAMSANGLPGCQKGAITHLNATVPIAGVVKVTGPAPQAIEPTFPNYFGGPGVTTGSNATMTMATGGSVTMVFAMPGVAGINGGARWNSATCILEFTPMMLPAILTARTQKSRATIPAEYTFHLSPATTMSGAMVQRNVLGTMPEVHRLSAGGGPGSFVVTGTTMNPAVAQQITAMSGPNRFGGGFRASGGGKVTIKLPPPFGGSMSSATGYWSSPIRFAGHNRKKNPATTPVTAGNRITQILSQTGTFTTAVSLNTVPLRLKAWLMPFTTGTVMLFDNGGTFTTSRTLMGYDNRNAAGTTGKLLLVSPWVANILGFGPGIFFGGTVEAEWTFLPEPGPTAALAGAVVLVMGLHLAARRRR